MESENASKTNKGSSSGKVFVTFVNSGGISKKTLDWEEAENSGVLGDQVFDLIPGPHARDFIGGGRVCPQCGFTQKEFEQRGRFGCPDCYKTFEDVLPKILKKMHKGHHHVGKIPRGRHNREVLRNRLKYLEKEMEDAIRSERFEDAAIMRDQIREIQEIAPEPETPRS